MTWFGMVSAWAALAMGALFGVNAYFQFATGVSGWIYAATALLLLLGGFRTLRKMSGGLRLLAGAWGLAAGVLSLPLMGARPEKRRSTRAASRCSLFRWPALHSRCCTKRRSSYPHRCARETRNKLSFTLVVSAGGRSGDRHMQVTKLRASADGLVPAGAYFANLSRKLKDANARGSSSRAELDREDRDSETQYRRCSASRTYERGSGEMHA